MKFIYWVVEGSNDRSVLLYGVVLINLGKQQLFNLLRSL